jgi:hypothetical protein
MTHPESSDHWGSRSPRKPDLSLSSLMQSEVRVNPEEGDL